MTTNYKISDIYKHKETLKPIEELKIYLEDIIVKIESELNIITGSPAVLLKNILQERGLLATVSDPYVDDIKPTFKKGIFSPSLTLEGSRVTAGDVK